VGPLKLLLLVAGGGDTMALTGDAIFCLYALPTKLLFNSGGSRERKVRMKNG
jgi:hypothetical protein